MSLNSVSDSSRENVSHERCSAPRQRHARRAQNLTPPRISSTSLPVWDVDNNGAPPVGNLLKDHGHTQGARGVAASGVSQLQQCRSTGQPGSRTWITLKRELRSPDWQNIGHTEEWNNSHRDVPMDVDEDVPVYSSFVRASAPGPDGEEYPAVASSSPSRTAGHIYVSPTRQRFLELAKGAKKRRRENGHADSEAPDDKRLCEEDCGIQMLLDKYDHKLPVRVDPSSDGTVNTGTVEDITSTTNASLVARSRTSNAQLSAGNHYESSLATQTGELPLSPQLRFMILRSVIAAEAEEYGNEDEEDDSDTNTESPVPISEAILSFDNPRRPNKPKASSPLNPYRSMLFAGAFNIKKSYVLAFYSKGMELSSYRRNAFAYKQRTLCDAHQCHLELRFPWNKILPRCWKCRHISEPLQIWEWKASERWRKQRKEQDSFEDRYNGNAYDQDEYDMMEVDYSGAYL